MINLHTLVGSLATQFEFVSHLLLEERAKERDDGQTRWRKASHLE
jgi:hypothetical protein